MWHIEIIFLIVAVVMAIINWCYYLEYNDFFGIMTGTWRGTCNCALFILICLDLAIRWFIYSGKIVNWLFS